MLRRDFIKQTAFAGAALLTAPRSGASAPGFVYAWAGGVTDETATVVVRTDRDAILQLAYATQSDFSDAQLTPLVTADAGQNNRIVRFVLEGLAPDTTYFYALADGGGIASDVAGQLKTFPDGPASMRFVFGSCARTGSNDPVFDQIRAEQPDLFIHCGDLHYEDIARDDEAVFQAAYEQALAAPRQSDLYRSVPAVYMWDDHDFGPNNSDSTSPSRRASRLAYRQVVPHYPLPAGDGADPVYHAFWYGRIRFIVTDLRSEKTPPGAPDDASKSMMGAAQKAWFKQELVAAQPTASMIVWVNTVPWVGLDGDDGWHLFATERTELSNFFRDNEITNLLVISGDAHMLAIDNAVNTDYADGGGGGFLLFHASPFDKEGRVKGGPYEIGPIIAEHQYGKVQIEDAGGTSVRVVLTGHGGDGTEKMRLERTFVAPLISNVSGEQDVPARTHFEPPYPNPARDYLVVPFTLAEAGPVTVSLYTVAGQHIRTVESASYGAGTHSVRADLNGLAAGRYLVEFVSERIEQRRLVVVH
ncbi:MAG: alkaline phosphatase D family protein [Bacteroidota bacterium]